MTNKNDKNDKNDKADVADLDAELSAAEAVAAQENAPADDQKSSKKSSKRGDGQKASKKADNGTVTVGCRLPAGLRVEVDGFGTLEFKGANDRRALAMADEFGFHGITSDVPADAWRALEKQYSRAKWLRNGFVFATGSYDGTVAEAQGLGNRDAGFNPVDPEALGVAPADKT